MRGRFSKGRLDTGGTRLGYGRAQTTWEWRWREVAGCTHTVEGSVHAVKEAGSEHRRPPRTTTRVTPRGIAEIIHDGVCIV